MCKDQLLASIAEIEELPSDFCLDLVGDLRIYEDGELQLCDVEPEVYASDIPESVWHGRVLRLDFGVGVAPQAIAQWLSTRVDELTNICEGMTSTYDQHANWVGQLSEEAAETYRLLVADLEQWDDELTAHTVTRVSPEDYLDFGAGSGFEALRTAAEVKTWAADQVDDGDPMMCDEGGWIIIDLSDAQALALDTWRQRQEDDHDPA